MAEIKAKSLKGKVAVVTGSSRGAGRGVALSLGEAGATVYVTGRTTRGGPKPPDGAPETIDDAAEEVSARGGRGIAIRVDHTKENEVAALFDGIRREQGRIDLLVNAVWGGNEHYTTMNWDRPFWEQPLSHWQDMMMAGAYAYFAASSYAARIMATQDTGGLIIHITDGIDTTNSAYRGHAFWDLSHECINRMVLGMSREGKDARVAVLGLSPGFMRTERVVRILDTEQKRRAYGFDKSESTEYVGRAVVALAADPKIMNRTGALLHVADVAKEYGFTDIDGRYIPRFRPNV
jgi:NAD(P)-dependent dehydrogenase (short-subunit alcohol dehydrogenase family)